jgi:hypothetical protein
MLFDNVAVLWQPEEQEHLGQVVAQRRQGLADGMEFFLDHLASRPCRFSSTSSV